jgi:hypothetical protein
MWYFPEMWETLGEAEPNAESVVISELDLTTLTHQRDLAACARSTTSSMIFMNCGLRKKSKLSERIDLRIGID